MIELAHQFGSHRATVSGTLRREGAGVRMRGLDREQTDEAIKLYADGMSLARIGEHFGVDHGTVGRQLRKLKTRDTHGRPR
jgi:DNA invertase Pin-like site-specific DNA recombinase